MARAERGPGDPFWKLKVGWHRTGWQLAGVVALSAAFESLFLHHGINAVDEGWPLYAAMQLHAGGTLYRDVFFVFPPGHVLAAWIGWAVAPPGLVASRVLYGAFNVALCAVFYLLGRRLMPPGWAMFGAVLLAVAAPNSHVQHLLFGYRYLVFSALAVLAFAQRVESRDPRWMGAAGLCLGLALCFRLTPALAGGAGLTAGVLALGGNWRERLRDLAHLAGGAALIVVPVTLALLWSVGAETLFREVVVRPVAMTALQEKAIPPLMWPPSWDRAEVTRAFIGMLFRLGGLVYVAYGLAMAARWVRALARGERHPDPVLLTVVAWGGVYFVRSLGRSDEPHLMSAIPPLCLLLAHLPATGFRALARRRPVGTRVQLATALLLLGVWVFGEGSDRALDAEFVGTRPIQATHGRIQARAGLDWVDPTVERARAVTAPGDRLLVMGPESLLFVLSERHGPGWADVLMPGTFLDEAEERTFLERLERERPAAVLWPRVAFDLMDERSMRKQAPLLTRWVRRNYRMEHQTDRFTLFLPWTSSR